MLVCSKPTIMYGKIFGKMFDGSLYGKGWGPLLVMSYVIANAVPDREVGTQVELNPKALADKFGESEDEVKKAIEFLCNPDPDSTSTEEGGRRLIKIGAFAYRVVNGAKYRAIRDEEARRAQVRTAVARHRARKNRNSPQARERQATQATQANYNDPPPPPPEGTDHFHDQLRTP